MNADQNPSEQEPGKNQAVRALALISGGLDSLLAARLVQMQGVEVLGISFFFRFDVLEVDKWSEELQKLTGQIGIPVMIRDLTDDFFPLWRDPPHGYGSGFNPCVDCRLLMLRKAREEMIRQKAGFLVTGEVVGQRPMSQRRDMLFHIARVAELKGLILRPLCAKKLPLTVAEENGWVRREELYGFTGRSRKPQMVLADRIGIRRFKAPAGGCILTDPEFSLRIARFKQNMGKEALNPETLRLLRLGRHFWLAPGVQVIAGRDEKENKMLRDFQKGRWSLEMENMTGPLVLLEGSSRAEHLKNAAAITVRYAKKKNNNPAPVRCWNEHEKQTMHSHPASDPSIETWSKGTGSSQKENYGPDI